MQSLQLIAFASVYIIYSSNGNVCIPLVHAHRNEHRLLHDIQTNWAFCVSVLANIGQNIFCKNVLAAAAALFVRKVFNQGIYVDGSI